ncbi:MAG: ECF transporter S component, partial [Clostridia bacterium]|nr:ECF transporter S component [Clostridia bacterium]
IIAYFGFRLLHKRAGNFMSRILSGTLSEIIMILGYFVFEGILYGFVPSLVNIPANAVQGVAGLIIGTMLIKVFENNKIISQ